MSSRPPERPGIGEAPVPPTGQQLLAEFVETGRQSAFEEIVRRYAGMVYNTCLRVTKSRQDAEDATQAVFLTLALQIKKGTEIKALGPWLQQVAKRLALDTRRGGKRRRTREEQHQRDQTWRAECSEPALPAADLDEVKTVLHEELNKLPSKYRLPLILHYFGGLSRDEMAAELNCNPSTLGVRIFRARALLAERLNLRGIEFTPAMLPAVLHQLVKCTISHAVIGATTRAAAAVAAGHNAAGLVSQRVIHLTRRAAAAALIGKLKLAGLGVVILCTLLAAGARALCTVPNLGLRDFLDRQVQSLMRPLLQPFSLPGPLSVGRVPSSGFAPIVTAWSPRMSIKPRPQLAPGWQFGPLVPSLGGDDMGLLAVLDVDPVHPEVPNIFAAIGHEDSQRDSQTDVADPAVAMASQDPSISAALLEFEGDAETGGAGSGAGLDLPQSADDGSTAAAGGSGGPSVGVADFAFRLPDPAAAGSRGGVGDDFPIVDGSHEIFSEVSHPASAARGSSRASGGDSTDPSPNPGQGNGDGSTKHSGGTAGGNGSNGPSRARPGTRYVGAGPWNLSYPPPPDIVAAIRAELSKPGATFYLPKPSAADEAEFRSLPVLNGPISPLFAAWEQEHAGLIQAVPASAIRQFLDDQEALTFPQAWADPLALFNLINSTSTSMSTPAIDPAIESVPTLVTPEPTGVVLLFGVGFAWTCRRRKGRTV